VGVVHRIDMQTSGVILVVISPRALRPFQNLFRTHTIERDYLAVVEGVFLTPTGSIDLPLVADAGDGRRGVSREPGQGVPATTHFRVVESYGRTASLVACRLETGRTHQIRIHLASIDHPVVGDAVYGRRGRPAFPVRFPRQALHAQALGFIHPLSGQPIRVESPLPADYVSLVDELKHKFGVRRVAPVD
jgi:23S rRNA pseudouridine1911/1915/1917 synthase